MPRLTDSDKTAVSQALKHAKLIKASRKLARIVSTVHPTKEQLDRRAIYEPDLAAWLKYYCADTYPDAWGAVHLECITRLHECILTGGCFALAMPRGAGKSSIGKGASVYAPLTGKRRYVVPIGATDQLANDYLDFIKAQLDGSNERIAEDYPEAVRFFMALEGKAIKGGPNQLRQEDGKSTGISWRAKGLVFPSVYMEDGVTLYPFSGARVECRGITAAMKGMSKTVGGKIIRPDFVLTDDAQTEDDAISTPSCDKIESKIIGTVLALAGPRKRIACFMPCTIAAPNDVSCRFLDRKRHPEFQGVKVGMILQWPDAQRTLWAEYAVLRREAKDDATGKAAATAYYIAHREEMDAGARVSWDSRIRDGEISAIETAENLLIEYGEEKFAAEMQQEPIDVDAALLPYEITEEIVKARATKRAVWERPDWASHIIATSDVNPSYALTTAVQGFGQDQTAAVLWYGLHACAISDNLNKGEYDKQIFAELLKHGMELAAATVRPEFWAIDAGGKNFDPVIRFCEASSRLCGIPAMGFTGRGWKHYKEVGRTYMKGQPRREMCHIRTDIKDGRHIRWIVWHADHWKEMMQRACLGAVGSPGGLTLPAGNHREFANQLCAAKLIARGEFGGDMEWKWFERPGKHDYFDCMGQGYAAAAYLGIGTGGAIPPPKQRKRYTAADLRGTK